MKLRKVTVLDTQTGEILPFEAAETRLREKVTSVLNRIIIAKINEDYRRE